MSNSWSAPDNSRRAPDTATVVRLVLVVLAVFGALGLVYQLRTIILLLVFSVLFAYLVTPVVAFVQRRLVFGRGHRKLPPGLAIGIAYLLIFGAVALLFVWVAQPVSDAVKQVPQRMQMPSGQPFNAVYGWLQHLGVSASMIDRAVSAATSTIDTGARQLATAFVHLAAYLPWLVLIPILAFFLLKDARPLTQATIGLLPERSRSHARALLARVDTALAAYIRAQLAAGVIVGVIVGVGFTVLRVPFAAVFGVAAGLAEFVPLVGPLVIALASVIVAAFRAPMAAIWVLIFLGVLRVLEDYVIYPRLIGSTVHLHPLAVILAVLSGAELGGVIGVLLSVPLLAIAAAVYRYAGESSPLHGRADGVEPRAREHPS